ncbi:MULTISPECIES: ferrous iron transport protein B [Vagococcus]|uniref:Ferrous iron transport protein B n=1 Tax=Vagococcus fluvialis bH819 TaxID=1255619 RepID=A0A1X6WPB7_9ENTE|nr:MULTISPECIES: ferrous iron transport protein B [Vagococcus]SLM86119.1 Ferrous iron transport protein B [Vagococcus fluvialis bH819]HCM90368.1 ferrous iron transport protein B [Vagococcus sp.]
MKTQKHVALVGNPNSGKTSLFNELTGTNQSVGNWPGVTVERKSGRLKEDNLVILQDLPGIYSLSPYSPEEGVARDYLLHEHPERLLNIVDGTNLERNLYLTTQLLELGIPMDLAVNMMDVVSKEGTIINCEKLAYGLGISVYPISVIKRDGLDKIKEQITADFTLSEKNDNYPVYDDRLEVALSEIKELIHVFVPAHQLRWFTIKLFERDVKVLTQLSCSEEIKAEIEEIIQITEKILDEDSESIIINERYEFISQLVALSTVKSKDFKMTLSDKIDRIVTNRWLALPIFALIMWAVYYLSIQTVGTMGTDWINDVLFGEWVPNHVTKLLNSWQIDSWLQSLILDGIIAGVGAVLGFLPQLMVLFLCLSLLEDCGYMARIAFVMDRLFRRFGLSGKSFIPMLIATGCGVPGVMASRTIENEKDRRMTIMTTTFMPCSAKLPIIGLIAGAFFPTSSWVAPSAYFIGIGTIVLSGIMLKKTSLFSGKTAPFIMEMPTYHLPRFKNSVRQMMDRSLSFVKKAGTIIFASSVIIWFLNTFNFSFQMVETEDSILASLGRGIAFIFAPLGWGNWQTTVATITGLIAKENVVGTFGILYGHQELASEVGKEYWPLFRASLTPIAGYSFLVFNLLCAPCFAAIGAIRREMNDWKWTTLAISYQCFIAYIASFIIYQLGSFLFENHSFGIGQSIAIGFVLFIIFFLVKKPVKKQEIVAKGIEIL